MWINFLIVVCMYYSQGWSSVRGFGHTDICKLYIQQEHRKYAVCHILVAAHTYQHAAEGGAVYVFGSTYSVSFSSCVFAANTATGTETCHLAKLALD